MAGQLTELKMRQGLNLKDPQHAAKALRLSEGTIQKLCEDPEPFYRRKEICSKNGKLRRLATPRGDLRRAQNRLQQLLQGIERSDFIHGGIRKRSYITNAKQHLRSPMVLTLDLENFFPSISNKRVYDVFVKRLGCSPDVARILTRLTTLDGVLPQGAPTSTILAVLVAEPLGKRLSELARQHDATFTQYIDDITFSGRRNLDSLIPTIKRIIEQEGFRLNSKTRKMPRAVDQTITGVRVNAGVDVPRGRIKKIRRVVEAVAVRMTSDQRPDEAELQSLQGQINYVQQLNPGAGNSLAKRFRRATHPRSASRMSVGNRAKSA